MLVRIADADIITIDPFFEILKRVDLSLARAWRHTTRAVFQATFDRGYRAIEYIYQDQRSYYLLQHES